MQIRIENCNNIDLGIVSLDKDVLNIKYAINGTGKSTISKAITKSVSDRVDGTNEIKDLLPFKLLGTDVLPVVSGCEDICSIKVFNEDYINDFTYQPDELLKGSFDILIRDDNFDNGVSEIETLVSKIKSYFLGNDEIESLISDLDELSKCLGKPTKTGLHKSSAISKSLGNGNIVENIPAGLESYKDFIQSDSNVKWVKWQIEGQGFLETSDNCPYCIHDVRDRKEDIKKVSQTYDSGTIQSLNKLLTVFESLNVYFSPSTQATIAEITGCIDGYTDDHVDFIIEVKNQVDRFNEKLKRLKEIGFATLKDDIEIVDKLREYKVNISLYTHLNSDLTRDKVFVINDEIDTLIESGGILKGKIQKHKRYIESLVAKHNDAINNFLRNAGYKYSVSLMEDSNGVHKLKLLHSDLVDEEVSRAQNVLSYGEKNAFALVLFMFDAVKSSPDLVILDDPISSFDKNKKYAIIEMLFKHGRPFSGKTVLLLSHDFEPIVDMLYHHTDRFVKPSTAFLRNDNGRLIEEKIEKSDVRTFYEINNDNIESARCLISKLVYLRRNYEILNSKGDGYQLVSSILHRNNPPTVKNEGVEREMTQAEIEKAVEEVREVISNFDYQEAMDLVSSDEDIVSLYMSSSSGYEKLHLYRVLSEREGVVATATVVMKFINQAFHIENDYIYQLNPERYQTVPQYIIDECDAYVQSISVPS